MCQRNPYTAFDTIGDVMRSAQRTTPLPAPLLSILLLLVLACPAASEIEDVSIYEDYVTLGGDLQSAEVRQGESVTFSLSATNTGNRYYDSGLKFRGSGMSGMPEGVTAETDPVKSLIGTGETVWYQVTIRASETAPLEIYVIEIADNSDNDPNTWRTVSLSVLPPPPLPTPTPTKKVKPIARGIPTRPGEEAETDGFAVSPRVLFVIAIVLSAMVVIGAAIFINYRKE